MLFQTNAILCSARAHGEHGAVVRLFTRERGLMAAYVHGGTGRRMRPLLGAGNLLQARFDTRREGQLARAALELVRSRAALAADPLQLAVCIWASGLLAAALPEGDPFPAIYDQTDALLDLMGAGPPPLTAGRTLAEFELSLLSELGFRLDLDRCAVSGRVEQLRYVSPKSGRGVSAAGAAGYEERLFPLPAFFSQPRSEAGAEDILHALAITRHFLLRDALQPQQAERLAETRGRIDAWLARLL